MKPKKLSRKLSLNKETIVTLNKEETRMVHAGERESIRVTCGSCGQTYCCPSLGTCGSGEQACNCVD